MVQEECQSVFRIEFFLRYLETGWVRFVSLELMKQYVVKVVISVAHSNKIQQDVRIWSRLYV